MEKTTMTYGEAYRNNDILKFVLVREGEKQLSAKHGVALMRLKGAYSKAVENFEQGVNDTLKEYRKEGWEKRFEDLDWYQKYLQRKESDEEISEDDAKRALEIEPNVEEYKKEVAELNAKYFEIRKEKAEETIEINNGLMPEDFLEALIEAFGYDGNVEIADTPNGVEMKRSLPRVVVYGEIAKYLLA